MLMVYRCSDCGHQETIWNSRDGVTPFGVACPSCNDGNMRHVDWWRDAYAPSHQLRPGQRYFRDGTPEEAAAIMRHRLEMLVGGPYEVGPDKAAELIELARDGREGEFQPGWPKLDQAPLTWEVSA